MHQDQWLEDIMAQWEVPLLRTCYLLLRDAALAEDAVQEAFIKYMQKAPRFESTDHEKAWLITVATNRCRDMLRFRSRHPVVDMDEIYEYTKETSDSGILDALMTLPDKYRIVLILYYVEEFNSKEIAKIVGRSTSAVKMRLAKGRELLREAYRKECM